MRVPTSTVSVVDLTAMVERPITKDELFAAFDAAAAGRMKGILQVVREPLVSIDFKGSPLSSSVDDEFTNVYGTHGQDRDLVRQRVGLQQPRRRPDRLHGQEGHLRGNLPEHLLP